MWFSNFSEKSDIPNLGIQDIGRKYGSTHPHILGVFNLLLVIPAASAEVERGFSQLKLVKTKLRTRLSEKHLNILLDIKMLAKPISKYNPSKAIELWNASSCRIRRPNFGEASTFPKVERTRNTVAVSATELESATASGESAEEGMDVGDGAAAEAVHMVQAQASHVNDETDSDDSGLEDSDGYQSDNFFEEENVHALVDKYNSIMV